MSLTELFGDKIVDQTGKSIDPADLSKNDAVLVYFSAHWCPPCKMFTPQLVKSVKRMKANGKKLEAIFVSSDRDEGSYNKYFAEMEGFLSLPYSDRARKGKLSALYKVEGIPTLVVLSGKGEVITKKGREAVSTDPDGKNFPWIPPTFATTVGSTFLKHGDGGADAEIDTSSLKGKTVGIYFSAHWCGPCRSFTPELIKTYNVVKSAGKPFEIVFVSSDHDERAFKEYFGEMPWIAVPFSDSKRRSDLGAVFNVEGIPTFVIVDWDTGKVIQREGRGQIAMDPTGKEFPWLPKPVNELNRMTAGSLNEIPSVIAFLPSDTSEEDEKKVIGALEPWGKEVLAAAKEDPEFGVFVAKQNVLVDRVRALFGKKKTTVVLGLLDIQSQAVFVAPVSKVQEITDSVVRKFVEQYKAGSLEPTQIQMDQ